jgi:hypothetical protein
MCHVATHLESTSVVGHKGGSSGSPKERTVNLLELGTLGTFFRLRYINHSRFARPSGGEGGPPAGVGGDGVEAMVLKTTLFYTVPLSGANEGQIGDWTLSWLPGR